jgi:hypothetical protein
MDYDDHELTITEIKTKLSKINNDITVYKREQDTYYQNAVQYQRQNVIMNNGTVTCNKYCHGIGGLSWNNELPIAWKGAQCVIGGANGDIPCNRVGKDPNSSANNLPCLCQRNDKFPYETKQNAWGTPEILSPPLPESNNKLVIRRDTILQEMADVNKLLNSILPKQDDNQFNLNSNIAPLLKQIEELKVTSAELKTLDELPDLFDANFEITKLTTTSNFNKYILYFLFAAFVVGCLAYITQNPDSGNLDMFILALAILILVYYVYEYLKNKRRSM